jgi:hypothetical protein
MGNGNTSKYVPNKNVTYIACILPILGSQQSGLPTVALTSLFVVNSIMYN